MFDSDACSSVTLLRRIKAPDAQRTMQHLLDDRIVLPHTPTTTTAASSSPETSSSSLPAAEYVACPPGKFLRASMIGASAMLLISLA